jgi:hypothetical protein
MEPSQALPDRCAPSVEIEGIRIGASHKRDHIDILWVSGGVVNVRKKGLSCATITCSSWVKTGENTS